MKKETLGNAIWMVVLGLFGISGLAVGIVSLTWWNIAIGVIACLFAYMMYLDSEYGVESVQAYIKRVRTAKK